MATIGSGARKQNGAPANGKAQTETSVMASIDDLLREHRRAVEREEIDARRRAEDAERARLDALRRAEAEAEERARIEAEEARRRAHEEERRAAELAAMHHATVERARMEADAQARLAEMALLQEQEKQLFAIRNDRSKKNWKVATLLSAVVLLVAVGGGATAIKVQMDKQRAAETELAELRGQIAQAEQEKAQIKAQLDGTKDPARIAQLEKELADKNAAIGKLTQQLGNKGGTAPKPTFTATVAPTAPPTSKTSTTTPCKCMEGDPTCTCIKI